MAEGGVGNGALDSEQGSDLALPRHHRELVDGADDERRALRVHVRVDDVHRQAVAESARVGPTGDAHPRSVNDLVVQVVQGAAAPGALPQLHGVAAVLLDVTSPRPTRLVQCSCRRLHIVGGRGLADPEADRDGRRFGQFLDPNHLQRTDESCGALVLLKGQETQCVTHQDRHSSVAGITQAAEQDRDSDDAEVRLGLPASSREPEEVRDQSVRMVPLGEAAQVGEDERDLEGAPRSRRSGRWVAFLARPVMLLPAPLLRHCEIHQLKGAPDVPVRPQQLDA